MPDEIKEAVEKLEKDDAETKIREEQEAVLRKEEEAKRAEEERLAEVERVKLEVQDAVKRKAEDAPMDELIISKKAKVEEDEDEDSDESEEEDWQREAAAQLAAEAEEEKKRVEEEAKREKEEAEEEARRAKEAPQLNMPAKVDLSIEEAKALFKVGTVPGINAKRANAYGIRLFFAKRTSIRYTHGIMLYRSLYLIHDTYFSPLFQQDVKPSMNTVAIVRVS